MHGALYTKATSLPTPSSLLLRPRSKPCCGTCRCLSHLAMESSWSISHDLATARSRCCICHWYTLRRQLAVRYWRLKILHSIQTSCAPVFTVVALEEPENSLSPHYLGRIVSALNGMTGQGDAQALIATHAPSMLRRVARNVSAIYG